MRVRRGRPRGPVAEEPTEGVLQPCERSNPLLRECRQPVLEFARFALVGVVNTGVDVAVFAGLTWLGVSYLAAQVVSYSCGTANSYVLNNYWTFRRCRLSYGEAVRFAAVNLVSLGLSLACLRLLHGGWGVGLAPAKATATVCGLAANFLGSKLWVFR